MGKVLVYVFVITTIVAGIISLFIENERGFKERNLLLEKIEASYVLEYESNLNKKDVDLVKSYIESIPGLTLTDKINPQYKPVKEKTGIPELDIILSDNEFAHKSDFGLPYESATLLEDIGMWRCGDDGKVFAININYRKNIHNNNLDDYGFLNVDCGQLKNGKIIRKGNKLGGWVIQLPDSKRCPFLTNDSSGSECANSLRAFMAESIADTNNRLKYLSLNEKEIQESINHIKNLLFSEVIAEAFKDHSDSYYSHKKDEVITYKKASKSFNEAVLSINGEKPKMILSSNSSYVYNKNQYFTIARLWDENEFFTVKLTPENFEESVVVVAEQFIGARLIEIPVTDGYRYIDLSEKKVFLTFESWVRFLLAKRRLFDSGFQFKTLPSVNESQ